MRLVLSLILTVALAACAAGQDSLLVVQTVQQRDTPFEVKHPSGVQIKAIFAAASKDGSVIWSYLPEKHFLRGEEATIVAAPPGEYLITAGGSQIIKVIEEGAPEPPPGPSPGPQPNPVPPDPQPKPKPKPDEQKIEVDWAMWVHESSERLVNTSETSTMYSAELIGWLEEMKIKRRVFDKDLTGPSADPWIKQAGDKLPRLILLQEDPQKALMFPAPKTVQEAKELIKEHRK